MKAFWWFKDGQIAGMARPGFNDVSWFEFPFDEGLIMSWLGKFSSESEDLVSFKKHAQEYAPKMAKFYQLDEPAMHAILDSYNEKSGIVDRLMRLQKRTSILKSFDVTDDRVHFKFCEDRIRGEIDFLKKQEIEIVVSLTEQHHHKEILQDHFDLHHFGIEDLNAPQTFQALQLAEVIEGAKKEKKRMAVHCLAGIGRTSTMLMAAHLIMGETVDDMRALLAQKNPAFRLVGPQAEFIQSITSVRRLSR